MAFWIIGGAILLIALLASSGKRTNASGSRQEDSHWIYHPHVINPDDYECSRCHSRFRKETMSCPKCGTRMTGKTIQDEDEWIDEEETLDIIFDDD
ncbi:MAG: hypothetical protein J6A79_01355 [Clostridia bacterium]|nr:hypothetical protein [Clostridia bacterium]